MTLITCPACTQQVSDRAATCPKCGQLNIDVAARAQTAVVGQPQLLAEANVQTQRHGDLLREEDIVHGNSPIPSGTGLELLSVRVAGLHADLLQLFQRGQRRLHEPGLTLLLFEAADQFVGLDYGGPQRVTKRHGLFDRGQLL